jgi:hypothetical protein
MMANKVVAMVVMTTPSSQALLDQSEQETKVKKKALATPPSPIGASSFLARRRNAACFRSFGPRLHLVDGAR